MTTPGSRRTILVSDDDETYGRLLELLLEARDYRVITTRDGHEALTYLQSSTPDAMILDVRMPHMSGFDVARRVRRVARLRQLPIFFLTSSSDEDTKRQAEEVGAAGLLQKPLGGGDLRYRLDAVLGRPNRSW